MVRLVDRCATATETAELWLGGRLVAKRGEGIDQARVDGLTGPVDDPGTGWHVDVSANGRDDAAVNDHRAVFDGPTGHGDDTGSLNRVEGHGGRPRRPGLRLHRLRRRDAHRDQSDEHPRAPSRPEFG